MKTNKNENDTLLLIPKAQCYIEYMLDVIMKLPRTEKFNIGNEYKQSTYRMLNLIIYLNKADKQRKLEQLVSDQQKDVLKPQEQSYIL